jgi:class 3 adenylate cyclase
MDYEIRYARSGKFNIAWCTVGSGAIDVLLVPGLISHLDSALGHAPFTGWLSRLTPFCRLILMDKRGQGLSDRDVGDFTLEQRMDDLRAVLDAAGSSRAVIFGVSEGGPLSILLAGTYPERVRALILAGVFASPGDLREHPAQAAANQALAEIVKRHWGEGRSIELWGRSLMDDPGARKFAATFERAAATPGAVIATLKWISQLDVRPIARALKVPVLVWHRTGDPLVAVSHGRWLGQNIPGARYVEEPGADHLPWIGRNHFIEQVREFLTGSHDEVVEDRILATVLFTDIVGSTELAAKRGDHEWVQLLEQHRAIVRDQLERHRGKEVDDAGDGFFAVFDGPARAVQCAARIRDAVRPLGLEIRSGIHTGECERTASKFAGIAVHTAARVMALAQPGEVLVSRTVKDLVAGSGLSFEERGAHELKGVPGTWEVFAARQ